MTASSSPRSGRLLSVNIVGLAAILISIAFSATVAIPAFFARPEVSLDNAAVLMAQDLRSVQNHAVIRGEDMLVVFHPLGDGYRAITAGGVPMANPAGGGDFDRRYSVDAVFERVQIRSVDAEPDEWLRYGADGFCYTDATIVIGYRDEVRTLRVASGTGRIEVDGLRRAWRDTGR